MALILLMLERLLAHRHLRSGAGGRSAAVPASVLVLFAPGRLHHDPAGHGHRQRSDSLLRPQVAVRLHVRGLFVAGHRLLELSGLGPSHVRGGHLAVCGAGLLLPELSGGRAVGDQGLQLDGHALQGVDCLRDADAVLPGVRRAVHGGRTDRPVSGDAGRGHARARHLLRDRPLPFHHGGRHGDGLHGRAALLVAQDNRAACIRNGGRGWRRSSSSSASS